MNETTPSMDYITQQTAKPRVTVTAKMPCSAPLRTVHEGGRQSSVTSVTTCCSVNSVGECVFFAVAFSVSCQNGKEILQGHG